jgi:hypothetical protein
MMTILKELASGLIGMFFAETRLAAALLTLVAATGLLIHFAGLDRLTGGAMLLFGSLAILVASVCRAARQRAS